MPLTVPLKGETDQSLGNKTITLSAFDKDNLNPDGDKSRVIILSMSTAVILTTSVGQEGRLYLDVSAQSASFLDRP